MGRRGGNVAAQRSICTAATQPLSHLAAAPAAAAHARAATAHSAAMGIGVKAIGGDVKTSIPECDSMGWGYAGGGVEDTIETRTGKGPPRAGLPHNAPPPPANQCRPACYRAHPSCAIHTTAQHSATTRPLPAAPAHPPATTCHTYLRRLTHLPCVSGWR